MAIIRYAALAAVLVVLGSHQGLAQSAGDGFEMWPGAQYDPAIPTIEAVTGHAPGARITWHADVLRYFDALAKAAPNRVKVMDYATTWEGRKLIYAVISSPGNIARLAEISAAIKALADPRETDRATADKLIAGLPGTTWLSYGVHGNEISSTDAAMMTAYHLLAATNDPRVPAILKDSLVFIDPMQNPDGRDRFIHHFEMAEGLRPDSSPLSADHIEQWPGGRTNHYLFDLNRDWFALTQPETRGRVRILQDWFPLAFVDAHEMGGNASYYFSPEAVPFNPHLAADQTASLELFGRNNARYFDRFGFDYFTREVFDAFYPGYGASWPSYFGSIAMTYEQASTRGLIYRRYDGKEFRYRDTVRHHFVTSLSTAEVVATNRVKLLTDFYNYRLSAIDEGAKEAIRAYVIPAQRDQDAADKLVGLLVAQGVEVGEAGQAFRACGKKYPASSYVIRLAQPAKRLIRTLLDVNVPMEPGFVAEQERRRAKKLPDEIYDATAWSMPLMFNVAIDACGRDITAPMAVRGPELFRPGAVSGDGAVSADGAVSGNGPRVAYLVPWGGRAAIQLLAGALDGGLDVKSSDKAFTHQGRVYPAGSLILEVDDNPADLGDRLAGLARDTGAEVVGVNDSWITKGPNFGSNNVVSLPHARIAMAWDQPTSSLSAGNSRFVIERQFGYPVTAIRTAFLRRGDLSRFDVLILPDQSPFSGAGYAQVLGQAGAANLKAWVKSGGVLVALGGATRYLAGPDVDLIAIRREDAAQAPDKAEAPGPGPGGKGNRHSAHNGKGQGKGKGKSKPATVPGTLIADDAAFAKAIAANKDRPDSVAGILARAAVDPDHWLGAGVAPNLNVLVRGRDIYQPIKRDKGVNVARFAGPDELLASGYMWAQNRKQLAFKPFVVAQPTGRGLVVAFTQDPTVRAYLDGLNVILANAIFRAPGHTRPAR